MADGSSWQYRSVKVPDLQKYPFSQTTLVEREVNTGKTVKESVEVNNYWDHEISIIVTSIRDAVRSVST
jgi:hypothetical protein